MKVKNFAPTTKGGEKVFVPVDKEKIGGRRSYDWEKQVLAFLTMKDDAVKAEMDLTLPAIKTGVERGLIKNGFIKTDEGIWKNENWVVEVIQWNNAVYVIKERRQQTLNTAKGAIKSGEQHG